LEEGSDSEISEATCVEPLVADGVEASQRFGQQLPGALRVTAASAPRPRFSNQRAAGAPRLTATNRATSRRRSAVGVDAITLTVQKRKRARPASAPRQCPRDADHPGHALTQDTGPENPRAPHNHLPRHRHHPPTGSARCSVGDAKRPTNGRPHRCRTLSSPSTRSAPASCAPCSSPLPALAVALLGARQARPRARHNRGALRRRRRCPTGRPAP